MNKLVIPNYQPIAIISRSFGLSGEVQLKPTSRYFEKYIKCSDLFISQKDSNPIPIEITSVKGFGEKEVFKIRGVNSIEDAKIIIGLTIFVTVPLNDKINQVSKDLLNWKVISITKDYIGKLVDIMWCPANDIYIIKNHDKEYLIPVIDEFIKEINYKNKEIVISPIDGLIE